MQHFIIEHIHLLPDGNRESVQRNCYMEIKKGIITEIKSMPVPNDKPHSIPRVQGRGRWVLPGMYNTHMHTPMTLLRGTADDVPLKQWLEKEIWPREAKLERSMVQAGTDLALAEMIRSGTVAFLDMYHLHMDHVFERTYDTGMKAVLSRGMIGLGDRAAWPAKRNEAVELALSWNKRGEGRIKGMLFPHAPYTCPPEFMTQITAAAQDHNLMIGTHAAETAGEVQDYKAEYGRTPAVHLDELGFYEQQAVLTHAVHVSEEETALLKKKGAFISHNPMSNAKLGSGTAPVGRFLEAGIPVTLGTDSSASNNNLDMFQEMRMAALLQKGIQMDAGAVRAEDIFRMAASNGAKLLGFDGDGLLQPGGPADFIMLDGDQPHLQPDDHMASHVVYAASGQDVTDVFVDGNQLMKDRELLTIDEERVLYNARYWHKKLEQK
ncbi:amidohydrolase [Salibacterium lacus]|uniref:5-methylthioadenosine/S-adenosylhomocysteine deaminase n=1 Tax=Salibacterium lacus TaxID=1898109 RepID=A0ABW5SXQ3_9BACI